MIFFTRKYAGLVILVTLLGGLTKLNAQLAVNSPEILCVAVDSAGDVTLTWVDPPTVNANWVDYKIYMVGTTAPLHVVTVAAQTTYTFSRASLLPANAITGPLRFYIIDSTTSGNSTPADTASSINLSVINPGTGIAQLYWNAVCTPLLPGSSSWYKVYREYNYVWTLIDSTQSLSYFDTITYCHAFLTYRVQIADSDICISTSNWDTGTFENDIVLPQVIMDTVSVTSANTVDITWSRCRKNQDTGYIIYIYSPASFFSSYDTVYGINTTSYTYTAGNPSDSSLSFEVAALDSCGKAGAISKAQNTIYLIATPDLCNQSNSLSWNSYSNLVGSVGGYKVYCSINNAPFQLLGTTSQNVTTYTDSDLTTTQYRCYYVSVFDSTNSEITASSNRVCDSVFAPEKPRNNYLRTATVVFNTFAINVVAYVDDSLREAGYYVFERYTDSSTGFVAIDTIFAPLSSDTISYTDYGVNPSIQSYLYRVITLDECRKTMDTTNLGQTMLLTATPQPSRVNTLTWNDYGNWYEHPAYYLVYGSQDGVHYGILDTMKYSNAGMNTYIDSVDTVTVGLGIFYYYVKAVENDTTGFYPFIDTSYSNIADAYQSPVVFIPSAFDPYGVNKIFKPVGFFIGVKGYDFSIFNRWGNQLFESNDPDIGWNGKDGGSKPVEEGMYVYLLTYTSNRGIFYQQKGSVMLLK